MEDLLRKPHANNSEHGNRKYVHAGRMYYKQRDLKGDNIEKVSAECDQKSVGCKGRAWFWKASGDFIK